MFRESQERSGAPPCRPVNPAIPPPTGRIDRCRGGVETELTQRLADRYLASNQDAIDSVERSDPEVPDGVEVGADPERLHRVNHRFGGLDRIPVHSETALRWTSWPVSRTT